MHFRLTPRLAAVQAVCLGSAALSAAYYAGQAPVLTLATIAGVALNPVAIGLGGLAFALDLVKPQMLALAMGGRAVDRARRLAGGLVFVVLFVASMIAVDGMLIKLRSDWSGERGNAREVHARLVAEHKRAIAELASLTPARPVAELEAAMSAAPLDLRVWRRTAHCTDISKEESRKVCAPVLDLRAEMARATRRAELERQAREAKAKLDVYPPPASADPQAEALAKATGLDPTAVSYALIAILGFALELVSCWGIWLLTPRPEPPPAVAEPASGKVDGPRAGLDRIKAEIVRAGGTFKAENREIAALLGIAPGTASKWRAAWRAAGELTERSEDGRLVLELPRGRPALRVVG